MENIMKKLLLLSLLSIAGGMNAMERSSHISKDVQKNNTDNAIQFLRNTYSFAQAESEILPIIARELQKLNPDKWTARRNLNHIIKEYYNDFSQSEKNELMNAFSERWSHAYNRMLLEKAFITKR